MRRNSIFIKRLYSINFNLIEYKIMSADFPSGRFGPFGAGRYRRQALKKQFRRRKDGGTGRERDNDGFTAP